MVARNLLAAPVAGGGLVSGEDHGAQHERQQGRPDDGADQHGAHLAAGRARLSPESPIQRRSLTQAAPPSISEGGAVSAFPLANRSDIATVEHMSTLRILAATVAATLAPLALATPASATTTGPTFCPRPSVHAFAAHHKTPKCFTVHPKRHRGVELLGR